MNKEINDKLKELGVSIQADFIPTKYDKVKDARLNWYVTLVFDGKPALSTEYHAGIGHIEGYKNQMQGMLSIDMAHAILGVCNGVNSPREYREVKRPKLDPADVIYCLVNDASVLDHPDFESWASDYGYDDDSRSAEKIYQACLTTGLKMQHALGNERLEILRALFQDY